MFGPPPGFEDLMRKKYAILQQEADANSLRAQGGYAVDAATAQTSAARLPYVGPEMREQVVALRNTNKNWPYTNQILAAEAQAATAGLSDAEADAIVRRGQENGLFSSFTPSRGMQRTGGMFRFGGGMATGSTLGPLTRALSRYGFAKGTARVPGQGDGTRDTVPAALAPGEAVLNKPAAEAVGRGLISYLNSLGNMKMGMV